MARSAHGREDPRDGKEPVSRLGERTRSDARLPSCPHDALPVPGSDEHILLLHTTPVTDSQSRSVSRLSDRTGCKL